MDPIDAVTALLQQGCALTTKEWRSENEGVKSEENAYYIGLPADLALRLIDPPPEGVTVIGAPCLGALAEGMTT
jgi:hypothetical protein